LVVEESISNGSWRENGGILDKFDDGLEIGLKRKFFFFPKDFSI
jgi:hypothetical protein